MWFFDSYVSFWRCSRRIVWRLATIEGKWKLKLTQETIRQMLRLIRERINQWIPEVTYHVNVWTPTHSLEEEDKPRVLVNSETSTRSGKRIKNFFDKWGVSFKKKARSNLAFFIFFKHFWKSTDLKPSLLRNFVAAFSDVLWKGGVSVGAIN